MACLQWAKSLVHCCGMLAGHACDEVSQAVIGGGGLVEPGIHGRETGGVGGQHSR